MRMLAVQAATLVAVLVLPLAARAASVEADFNGDGYDDIAVASPLASIEGDRGALTVVYGGPDGPGSGPPAEEFTRWMDTPYSENDSWGDALASGDFNGDGFTDLAIGAPQDASESFDDRLGRVYVLYSAGAGGLDAAGRQALDQMDAGGRDLKYDEGFGSALGAGDFDADGIDDLVAGAPREDAGDSGAITVAYCTPAGLSRARGREFNPFDLGETISGWFPPHFGASVTVGDFDGDGAADVAASAPWQSDDRPRSGRYKAGVVRIIYGAEGAGLQPSGAQRFTQTQAGGRQEDGDRFGSVLAAGDFNGDGSSDLTVGVPNEALGTTARPLVRAGVVNVLYGSAAGLTSASARQFTQTTAGGYTEQRDEFGSALAAGDFDADGRSELAVGSPLEGNGTPESPRPRAGEVNVLRGADSGLTDLEAQRFSQSDPGGATEPVDRFGHSLAAADLDGDGAADLAVAAPAEGLDREGAVNILFGTPSGEGLTSAGALQFDRSLAGVAAAAGDRFGTTLTP